jgi:cold shock CspA family protein
MRVSKANSDLDLAVDMLLQSAKLDRVVLVSGDGDFVQVVRALQNKGCRVELIGFQNVSYQLRCESDVFVSGYLIPGLLPSLVKTPPWGEAGSRVRGTCYHYNGEKGFGFLRYLARLGDLTITDTREAESPYREAFFHRSQCPPGLDLSLLPNRDMVFDFTLVSGREGKMEANELNLVANYSPHTRWTQPSTWQGSGPGESRPPRSVARPVADAAEAFKSDGAERSPTPPRLAEPRPAETSPAAGSREAPLPAKSPAAEESVTVSENGEAGNVTETPLQAES